ncbi:MAG TPA: hypothetical protein VD927_12680 [Chryseosolibacter sp.]|nr:hypothetical protein [Chryseosolibacter sp.]
MKVNLTILLLLTLHLTVAGQASDKFQTGYFIDKFGERYDGELILQPGDGKNPGALVFRESKNGKKESYGPDYVKAFVIAADSFAVIEKIPLANRKVLAMDFARITLRTQNGTVYLHELSVQKKSGHASSAHLVTDEQLRYIIQSGNKLTVLNKGNLKEFANIVPDHPDLRKRILARKVKLENIGSAIDEYKKFKTEKAFPKQ